LPKHSCLKDSLGNDINLEECYVTVSEPETEILNIDPYQTLISPSGVEIVEITCPDEVDTLEVSEPSIIELPEGCTGIIDNHRLHGHQWDQDRKIKIYNELTPGVDEDEELMFKEPEAWDWQPTDKKPSRSTTDWLDEIETFGNEVIQSIYAKLVLGLILTSMALYCLCAPMSWPRCNCLIWMLRMLTNSTRQVIREIRRIQQDRRRPPDPLRPVEREMLSWSRRRGEI